MAELLVMTIEELWEVLLAKVDGGEELWAAELDSIMLEELEGVADELSDELLERMLLEELVVAAADNSVVPEVTSLDESDE